MTARGPVTRCPVCGRRPRRRTPARQLCDYCDSAWRWTTGGPEGLAASPSAAAALSALSGGPRRAPSCTLGVIASAEMLPAAIALCAERAPLFADAVILLDAARAPARLLPPGTSLSARPLAGNFGAQRSALQRLGGSAWMLQLDTDERLSNEAASRLPGVLAAADRDGVRALGLPRRNWVDGALSDHYPDPQYRLCRRTVRYAGRVHEAPVLPGRASSARLAIGCPIDHALNADRVRRRTVLYGAATARGARPGDERALLTPYAP